MIIYMSFSKMRYIKIFINKVNIVNIDKKQIKIKLLTLKFQHNFLTTSREKFKSKFYLYLKNFY